MPQPRYELIEDKRAIIDRRAIAEQIAALKDGPTLRNECCRLLGEALAAGRAEIGRRILADPARGRAHAAATSWMTDQLVRLIHDLAVERLIPRGNPTKAERLSLVALGGYGRGEMAPFSDVDLMFLIPGPRAPFCEQVIETILYLLWDLKLKVGQSSRTPAEVIALAKGDMSVRTAMLEGRFVWGDRALNEEVAVRFRKEVVAGTTAEFVAAKLAERDERHRRMGDSRYVVEPNVKDGKGGLRDLHTLYWIGQYIHQVNSPAELVGAGLLSREEYRRFDRAERFFWSVRCLLHLTAGRAEERLGFDHQRQISTAMHYADRPGKSAVERFMHFYFLQAKTVGDLTGVFLAHLDEQIAQKGRRFGLPAFFRRSRKLSGFVVDRGRLSIPRDDYFAEQPARLVEIFALAAREAMEIHPTAMRAAARDAKLVDQVRDDPEANRCFLATLTARVPDLALRWMNEAGVFGRFVPDFGRVVAQMQFDMYHHYTVDEHTIRAVGLLAAIERGELSDDHPLATALFRQIGSRRALYVAVLLHDIAKGRGGDHSQLGAEVALKLCPRLGLDPAETEMVSWLVRHHLLISNTAFKRDLADPKTIDDFANIVQSMERLRLLLMLTVVDIRAVGPGTWNDWKRRLLTALFDAAEERLRLGHKERGRSEQVMVKVEALGAAMGWNRRERDRYGERLPDSYWLAESDESIVANARQVAALEPGQISILVGSGDEGATLVTVFAPDREGLFFRICAGLASAGASIIDARIHTTRDGMALDNLLVQDSQGRAYSDKRLRGRLAKALEGALDGPPPLLPTRLVEPRQAAFSVAPSVIVAERASRRTTVVEVHAADRPALLARLTQAIHEQGLLIHSAHISTYGERAVDTFYLTRGDRQKLLAADIEALRGGLLAAAAQPERAEAA
ncbi:[protein-PII] uridylyltransferase [Sphingomonas ginkgonis]|uniref:Bifunctional uridylyltransferase/uridylyl-removing enzyme n=1 Tax=Sphingomonas ginkgonis TaxID=2315330 RepID=A0A3R9Y3X6_9SPHN|nr:[protein-PII] uridylyltransferase [Sphingomonas ginkgonis]RST29640.1 [protein-PII] uridylyltransferase [Sphingomonas ginkgonis]